MHTISRKASKISCERARKKILKSLRCLCVAVCYYTQVYVFLCENSARSMHEW